MGSGLMIGKSLVHNESGEGESESKTGSEGSEQKVGTSSVCTQEGAVYEDGSHPMISAGGNQARSMYACISHSQHELYQRISTH